MDEEMELKEGEIPEGMHLEIPEEEETVVDPLLEDDDEKKETGDGGMFGEDKELEDYMLSGYEER